MHSLPDVVAGLLVYQCATHRDALWSALRRATERFANSWHDCRLGPVRIINLGPTWRAPPCGACGLWARSSGPPSPRPSSPWRSAAFSAPASAANGSQRPRNSPGRSGISAGASAAAPACSSCGCGAGRAGISPAPSLPRPELLPRGARPARLVGHGRGFPRVPAPDVALGLNPPRRRPAFAPIPLLPRQQETPCKSL